MSNKLLFVLSFIGILAGTAAAYFFSITTPPLSPVFNPVSDPYTSGIYAEGIVESVQASGENINMYPEVPGTVKEILVSEGQEVRKGMPLLSDRRFHPESHLGTAEISRGGCSRDARRTQGRTKEGKPRHYRGPGRFGESDPEDRPGRASKQKAAYELIRRSVSKDALDSAINAEAMAQANLEVAKKQRDLTKAGAWIFDMRNQERQYTALEKSLSRIQRAAAKYTLRAPTDGVVLSIATMVGNYVSPQGAYESYTQGMNPVDGARHSAGKSCRSVAISTRFWCPDCPGCKDEGADVHPRLQCQVCPGLRADAADGLAEDRAVG